MPLQISWYHKPHAVNLVKLSKSWNSIHSVPLFTPEMSTKSFVWDPEINVKMSYNWEETVEVKGSIIMSVILFQNNRRLSCGSSDTTLEDIYFHHIYV